MIEEKLDRIAAALELIAKEMTAVMQPPVQPATVTPITPEPPKPKKPKAQKRAPAPEPKPEPVAESPWNSQSEMEEYVKTTYNELEQVQAGKGMEIVKIVQGMGVGSIKELTSDHYGDFYQKVEALRV